MGEYAEMMLDGTCCACCGEYLECEPAGYPVYCAGCEPDFRLAEKTLADVKPVSCPTCRRHFREEAHMKQHRRDKHGYDR